MSIGGFVAPEIRRLDAGKSEKGQFSISDAIEFVDAAPNGEAVTIADPIPPQFDVQMVENATLDGKPVFNFLMVPKSKDLTRSVARIQLWVDPETGLPLQHKIFHASGETQLEVRYVSIELEDELSVSLFQPKWPDGVEQIQR